MDNRGAHNTTSRPQSGAGGREDCWSEGATEILIEAWGHRYLKLSRGNLRQKDWKEVSDAVNARQNGVKPPRTDVQCKNRIDTLKKKYKLEKAKPSPSKWPFYPRLDYLIGTNAVTPSNNKRIRNLSPSSSLSKLAIVTFTSNSKPKLSSNSNPNPIAYSRGSSKLNSSGSSESSLGGGGGGVGGREDDDDVLCGGAARRHRMEYVDKSEASAYKELARAILRFGEIYERTESSKQQQMMELEKQRMEFTRELEVQRMNTFMKTQLELEKMKRPAVKHTRSGKKL